VAKPRPLRARAAALLLASLTSLASPLTALAHGVAHDHLRLAHHAADAQGHRPEERTEAAHDRHVAHTVDVEHDGDHGTPHQHTDSDVAQPVGPSDAEGAVTAPLLSSPQVAPAGHAHRHGHDTLDRAVGIRDTWRLAGGKLDAILPVRDALPDAATVQHTSALPEGVSLARRLHETGPPPTLRAPPLN
jgi:hypothetical protein